MRRVYWEVSILIVASVAIASALLYPQSPDRIPIHWNIKGQIDNYGSKTLGVFLLPSILVLLLGLFAVLPKLTPKTMSMEGFKDTYAYIIMISIGMLAFVHTLTLLAVTHHAVDFPKTMMMALYVGMALMGNMLGKVTRNPYVGIKVYWTLKSDAVWNATHRLGAWIITGGGMVGAIMVACGLPLAFTFIPLVVMVVVPITYSFLLYRRLQARGEL